MLRPVTLALLFGSVLLAPACRTLREEPEPGARRVVNLRPARSVEKRPIELHDLGDGEDVVLFLGTIHGDEPAGAVLLEELVRRLSADATLLSGKRAVILPVLNPDGLAAKSRRNANGVDLNRNLPASNFSERRGHGDDPLTQPESLYLFQVVAAYSPVLVLSIHQPADRIDYDGPAAGLAWNLAAVSPFEVRRMGPRDGSLGSWLGMDGGVPVVTVELPGEASDLSAEESWELYGPLLLEALRLAGR